MKFLGLFDKLKIVFDMITNSNVFITLLFLIIATIILRLTNKLSNKNTGIIIYLIELVTFGIVFINEKDIIINLSNDIINNIFLNFYFPSIYVYLFICVLSLVIFIYTLLNKFVSKTYKIITNVYFFTFNFIFILFVNVILKNNIDIFAKESLFTNNNALALLELSTLLFFIYLVVNTLVYLTNYVILLVENKKVVTNKNDVKQILNQNAIEITIDNNDKEEIEKEHLLSFNELVSRLENVEEEKSIINLVPEVNNTDTIIKEIPFKLDLVPEVKTDYRFFDPILLEEKEEVLFDLYEDNVKEKINFIDLNLIETKEDKITLNDYKLFSQMLKTVVENNNNSNLGISDILNKELLDKYSEEEYNKFEKILNSCLD